MSQNSNSRYISVFVPTYNGEKYIAECVNMILAQELPKGYKLEVIVIDSGSKDTTVDILRGYGNKIIFQQIPNSEFGHGKTRDKAARMSKGEFILFITQDATPADNRWLINMLEPFYLSERVACVFGRQVPRPFSVSTIKREVSSVFGGLGAADSIVIHRPKSLIDNVSTNPTNTFFSDANSAVRRQLLISEVPFRDLPYAEDQALAEDMQNRGYLKAYSPLGKVWHSNEYSAKEYYHRKFDEYTGLQESVGYIINPRLVSLVLGWIRPTLHDYIFIRHDGEYNKRAKLKFLALSPLYNFAEKLGKFHAGKYYHNEAKRQKLSLEARAKNTNQSE